MRFLPVVLFLCACGIAGAAGAEGKRASDGGAGVPAGRDEVQLGRLLDYLSGVSKLNIRAKNGKLEKLSVPQPPKLTETTTWRSVLESVCRDKRLRIDESRIKDNLLVVWQPERVSCAFRDADLRDVLLSLALQADLNIVIDADVKGTVSARFEDADWDVALDSIVKTAGFVIVQDKAGTWQVSR